MKNKPNKMLMNNNSLTNQHKRWENNKSIITNKLLMKNRK